MAGPYRCTDMIVEVDSNAVGVVTGFDINLSREGGRVEHIYGSETGYISHGGKRGTFRIQRWFQTASDKDLLYDLFNDKTSFTLTGEINGVSNTTITLTGCQAYSWRPILGDANSVIGEELSGEAINWSADFA